MALGIYTLILIAITVVSGISVALLFLTKNTKAKNTLFYFVSLWNILVAYISATSLPMNFWLFILERDCNLHPCKE